MDMFQIRYVSLFIILGDLAACSPTPVALPDAIEEESELELEPLEVDTGADSGGSAMLRVQHSIIAPLMEVIIDESFTILIEVDPAEPRGGTMIWGISEGFADFSITSIGAAGTHITTWQVPVSYEVNGAFHPFPRCEFEMQITEYLTLSEPIVVENTAVGEFIVDPSEDEVTFFPKVIFKGPGIPLEPLPGVFVTLDSIVLVGDTGCVYSNSEMD